MFIGICTMQGYTPMITSLLHYGLQAVETSNQFWTYITRDKLNIGPDDPTLVVLTYVGNWWDNGSNFKGSWSLEYYDHLHLFEQQVCNIIFTT